MGKESAMPMKKYPLIPIFWLILASYFSIAARKLGLGGGGRPGPGLFPCGAAVTIIIITLLRLFTYGNESSKPMFATAAREWWKIAAVLAGIMSYALLLEPLGFVLCTFLLMAFYLKVIASQHWPNSLAFAVSVALLSHLFFDVLLHAQLPRGLLAAFQ
jgi:putative tricarboxylic transport membrane protein